MHFKCIFLQYFSLERFLSLKKTKIMKHYSEFILKHCVIYNKNKFIASLFDILISKLVLLQEEYICYTLHFLYITNRIRTFIFLMFFLRNILHSGSFKIYIYIYATHKIYMKNLLLFY